MIDYDAMSDFEINKLMVARLGLAILDVWTIDPNVFIRNKASSAKVDYCNNPAHIMPIAIEYGFSIEIPDENLGGVGTITKYMPNSTDVQVDYIDKNETYRSIAICFLKMQESKQ